jgi:hypothetical protein
MLLLLLLLLQQHNADGNQLTAQKNCGANRKIRNEGSASGRGQLYKINSLNTSEYLGS